MPFEFVTYIQVCDPPSAANLCWLRIQFMFGQETQMFFAACREQAISSLINFREMLMLSNFPKTVRQPKSDVN